MTFWKKLLGSSAPRPVDYYHEGKALFEDRKFHEALTSFRLALKASPGDPIVLQEIAMCYTRIGMNEEAAKTYRHVLQKDPTAAGAHYGLAYILLKGERPQESIRHLATVRDDEQEYFSQVRTRIRDLDELLKADLAERDETVDAGWDTESLRHEFGPAADTTGTGRPPAEDPS